MSNERDELAKVLERAYDLNEGMATFELLAHATLAAGYRKPRTITTAEEVDAMPPGAAILTAHGNVYLACKTERHGAYKTLWQDDAAGRMSSKWMADSGSLPAIVLHEPEATK